MKHSTYFTLSFIAIYAHIYLSTYTQTMLPVKLGYSISSFICTYLQLVSGLGLVALSGIIWKDKPSAVTSSTRIAHMLII